MIATPWDRTVASYWFRDQRLARNMDQASFAKLLGCSQSFLSRIEAGQCDVAVTRFISMLHKMGLEVRIEPRT